MVCFRLAFLPTKVFGSDIIQHFSAYAFRSRSGENCFELWEECMKYRKEMNPDIFAQQPEKASCGAKVAVAVLQ